MILSMTGYGKTEIQLPTKKITIELKSLNSKNIDLNVRMPSSYKEKELLIRKKIAAKLVRGKVDFSIYVENIGDNLATQINQDSIKAYMSQLKEISPASDLELLKMAIKLPETLQSNRESVDDKEWGLIENAIDSAIVKIVLYRSDEGNTLKLDFEKRIEKIQNLFDENRFEQELIYYLEKLDITEEKVRLKNHLDYFLKELNDKNSSNGKKLGFITQEMGREINTLGSKANFANMQKIVVEMKDELEKIKEQNLNVL